MEKAIAGVFMEAQQSFGNHGRCVQTLQTIRSKAASEDAFCTSFADHLNHILLVFKRETAVERLVDFLATFATAADKSEEVANRFMKFFVDYLLKFTEGKDKAVRFRTCQLISKILASLGEEAEVDDSFWDNIHTAMMIRTKDKCPAVRTQAVNALSRLQDPTDPDCPVIAEYFRLMSTDSSPEVRKAVLGHLALSKLTVPKIIERTRDVKDSVRRHAFLVISEKVNIKALSIDERITLLKNGLGDREDSVKSACTAMVMKSWLKCCNESVLDLLSCLDVENSVEVVEQMLQLYLKQSSAVKFTLNDIKAEQLTAESSLLWRIAAAHYATSSMDDAFEELVPDVPKVCSILRNQLSIAVNAYASYQETLEDFSAEDVDPQNLTDIFIGGELLKLAQLLDLSDAGGQQQMLALVSDTLSDLQTPPQYVEWLVKLTARCCPRLAERAQMLSQIIAEVREPIQMPATPAKAAPVRTQSREIQLRLAKIKVDLFDLDDKKEQLVQAEDFAAAAEIKARIEKLQVERTDLLTALEETAQEITEAKEAVQAVVQESPQAWLRCLSMTAALLADLPESFNSKTPAGLIEMVESLVLPAVQQADPVIRNEAIRCLGLFCIHDLNIAKSYLLLFLQVAQVDLPELVITALRVMFDLMITFGPDAFRIGAQPSVGDEEENEVEEENPAPTGATVLPVLMRYLDHENADLRTVAAEGFSKLMVCGRITSSQLFSRLIILYFNPTTEEDLRLRQVLSVFFPTFAFASNERQQCVEDSFVPTLETFVNAPKLSPLSSVKIDTVGKFLLYLSDVSNLPKPTKSSHSMLLNSHDALALRLSNKILADSESAITKVYCRLLPMLSVSTDNVETVQELESLVNELLEAVEDRVSNKYIVKYHAQLTGSAKKEKEGAGADDDDDDADDAEEEAQHDDIAACPDATEPLEATDVDSKPKSSKKQPATAAKKTPAAKKAPAAKKLTKAQQKKLDEEGADDQNEAEVADVDVAPKKKPAASKKKSAKADENAATQTNLTEASSSTAPAEKTATRSTRRTRASKEVDA